MARRVTLQLAGLLAVWSSSTMTEASMALVGLAVVFKAVR